MKTVEYQIVKLAVRGEKEGTPEPERVIVPKSAVLPLPRFLTDLTGHALIEHILYMQHSAVADANGPSKVRVETRLFV